MHGLGRPMLWRSLCLVAALATLTVLATPAVHGGEPQRKTPMCGGQRATIVGTARNDKLTGTAGPDVIVGLAGQDQIAGRGGRDILCGSRGSDDLAGGRAGDRLFGGLDQYVYTDPDTNLIGDTLSGGRGNDRINPGLDPRKAICDSGPCNYPDQLSFARAESGVTVRLNRGHARGEGHDTFIGHRWGVIGSRFSDHVWGTNMRNTFDLGDGADVVFARGGNDDVLVGAGPDLIWDDAAVSDYFNGGDGHDILLQSDCALNTCRSIEENPTVSPQRTSVRSAQPAGVNREEVP
jgi:Ca2+-binding RTX toxin-like protein